MIMLPKADVHPSAGVDNEWQRTLCRLVLDPFRLWSRSDPGQEISPLVIADVNARRDAGWNAVHPAPATSRAPWRVVNIGATRKVNLMHFIEKLEQCLD